MAGKTHISLKLVSATALALALVACGQQNRQASIDNSTNAQTAAALPPLPEVQPLAAGPATPIRYAPRATALPAVRPLGYAEAPYDDRYAWIDRADWISDTIGDAPPDYSFDYDGVEPWAWQTSGDYLTYAEPIDDGYRYYYYEPGADYPYLVRDPQYTYGYRDGRIATVYDRSGNYLAAAEAQRQADAASRYYARARALRMAARERERRGVVATQWAARRPVIVAARTDWREARDRVPDWQSYRQRHASEESRRLQPERIVREQAAQRFALWQRDGRAGPPPELYVPTVRGDRREGARQAGPQEQRAAELQRQVAQQRAGTEQQQAAQRQQAEQQRAQQRAAQQQAQQRGAEQRGQQVRQQREAQRQQAEQQRSQQRAAQQQAQQRGAEQRGEQVRQQREAQRQQVEQQRSQQRTAQQQQVQQRITEQRGQQVRQQREAQRQQAEQQRSQQRAGQQQAQQQATEQRGRQMQQQREAQRQQAEQQRSQQRAAQQQQVQQRQQAQQQQAQQRAAQAQQQAAQQQQRAAQQAQQAQQRAAAQRPQPGQDHDRGHGNR